jgi:hypothetical protein
VTGVSINASSWSNDCGRLDASACSLANLMHVDAGAGERIELLARLFATSPLWWRAVVCAASVHQAGY